jgi:hypothetical protein
MNTTHPVKIDLWLNTNYQRNNKECDPPSKMAGQKFRLSQYKIWGKYPLEYA